MQLQRLTAGRGLMAASQILICAGSFLADFSHSHIFSRTWPPHAKFHNGQTMSLSALLSCTSLYLIFRRSSTEPVPSPQTAPSSSSSTTSHSADTTIDDLFLAAWIGSCYLLAGLSAIWYPGTAWMDPEFRKVRDVDEAAQLPIFGGLLVVLWVGWGMERRRAKKGRETRKKV